MPASKAHIKATNKWMAKAYDRINLTVPKGHKDVIQNAAAAAGQSVNAYINQALDERMDREAPTDAQKAPVDTQTEVVVSVPMEDAGSATETVGEEGEGIHE